ncbi:hypothetical protein Bmyc01_54460 [Bacillus mycoides]|uniref:Group-specific protein n=1 Tax=Bacillus cereus TaxID=1396 RepID=A0A2C0EA19_BACCE|nr:MULTISPECIES: hypothetical protein [Bacillus cereus group]GLV66777.1 hypothetical protein Bmyc01_54460 [Bacillus mycoides]MED1512872.1 hypothetical protein [Bacillus proteolyticus]MED1559343.1 hypothetical protein [Bacillus paramycoides]PGL56361.1 hypothetical protein CN927_28700 [Bacillus cereus]PGQ08812.1 hypothetical protein COA08_13905 [Bacillus cereus]
MRKRSLLGKILLFFGPILFVWGLIMLNVITDIIQFENTNKVLSFSILIAGIACFIASNFFKERKV